MTGHERRGAATGDLRRQIALTCALQVFAAVVLGIPMLVNQALVNDRLGDFYFFRDTLHALNVYGEFPWWNPSMWAGFPSYYVNFLYWPGREPLIAALALVAWLLGRLHITIESYLGLYVFYFAFLVPLLLSLSVLALARQVVRHRLAVYLIVVLSAFSPGVVFSVSDLGSEITAYGFFFAAAFIHFLRNPGRSSFLLLCLPALAMAAAFTYVELFWNIFFVPAFVVAVCVGPHGLSRRARGAFAHIPPRWWATAAAGLAVCALPTVVAYSHGADILSARAEGARYYTYDVIRPGTPLEALAISTPGIGFEWTDYGDPAADFEPRPISRGGGFASFGYMGLLALPLAAIGLTVGHPYWSVRLFAGIAAVMTMMLLATYSPFFSLLLGWASPLRGVNHYSDVVMRLGLFGLFLLAAGLGFEAVLRQPQRRRILVGLFAISAAASVSWLLALQGPRATHNYVFGLALGLIALYAVALTRLALARTRAALTGAVVVLFALTLVDTSTLAFAHLRVSLVRAGGYPREPGPEALGSIVGREETDFLYLRGLNDLALTEPPAQPATLTALESGAALAGGNVQITRRTYNTIAMAVTVPQSARLEWRDAYFPFWRAWVNDTEVAVERTSTGMKAVRVPPGGSEVVFRFSPTLLRISTAAAYAVMVTALVLWLRRRRGIAR